MKQKCIFDITKQKRKTNIMKAQILSQLKKLQAHVSSNTNWSLNDIIEAKDGVHVGLYLYNYHGQLSCGVVANTQSGDYSATGYNKYTMDVANNLIALIPTLA